MPVFRQRDEIQASSYRVCRLNSRDLFLQLTCIQSNTSETALLDFLAEHVLRKHRGVARSIMLRVTRRDDVNNVELKLEGKLAGCWVDVLEQCWKQVLEDSASKPARVDLTAITYVDGRGVELLGRIYCGGGSLHASACLGKGIVEDIQSRNGEPTKTGQ